MKSKVLTIANKLVGQGYNRSEAMKKAWAMVKAGTVETNVAGVTFENRQRIIERLTHYEAEFVNVTLEREADNQYDPNAVRIMVSVKDSKSVCVGYLPKPLAKFVAPLMDAQKQVQSKFEKVTGKYYNYYNYGLSVKISV